MDAIPKRLTFEVKIQKNGNLHLLIRKNLPNHFWQIMNRWNNLGGKTAESEIPESLLNLLEAIVGK